MPGWQWQNNQKNKVAQCNERQKEGHSNYNYREYDQKDFICNCGVMHRLCAGNMEMLPVIIITTA